MILTTLAVTVLLVMAPVHASADPFQELSLTRLRKPLPAPDFAVPGLMGGTVQLKEHRGSVVFLNFWATWCTPCRTEMPSMQRLYRRFEGRGFAILAISIDVGDAGRVMAFVKALDLTFPVGLDPKQEVADRYGVRGLPASFLINRAGDIVAVAIGPRDWDSRSAHAAVEALLK